MHKDALLLIDSKSLEDANKTVDCSMILINEKPLIHHICKHLSKFHFCKIVFCITPAHALLKDYILKNRKQYSFAFDFCEVETNELSGTILQKAIAYTDSDDVLVLNAHSYIPFNLEELVAWQHGKEADVTVALIQSTFKTKFNIDLKEDFTISFEEEKSKNTFVPAAIYSIFRHSFLNINFNKEFSLLEDYVIAYSHERDVVGYKIKSPHFDTRDLKQRLALADYLNNTIT
jgi:NDP-sugar pyrophosphorylase family protein